MRSSRSLQSTTTFNTAQDCFLQLKLLIYTGIYGNTSLELLVKGQISINNKQQLFWNETYRKASSHVLTPALKVTKTDPECCSSFPWPPLPAYTANGWPWTWQRPSPLEKLNQYRSNCRPKSGIPKQTVSL